MQKILVAQIRVSFLEPKSAHYKKCFPKVVVLAAVCGKVFLMPSEKMGDPEPTIEDLADQIAEAEEASTEFETYEGDEYLIKDWVDKDTSRDKAIAEIQDPGMLSIILSWSGLEYILADKYATAGLKKLLIHRHPGILAQLADYTRRKKPKGKSGPRPTRDKDLWDRLVRVGVDAETVKAWSKHGMHRQDIAADLDNRGFSNGKISIILYGDAKHANRVAALLNQARKKISPPIIPS